MHKDTKKKLFAFLAAGVAVAIAGGAAAVQQPITYRDKPVGPQSLPGDNVPPFMMLDASGQLIAAPPPPPGGFHRPDADGHPESEAPGPSLELSIAGAKAALAECKRMGARGAATVVDSAGDARVMLSADGSDGSHVFVAHRKALTSLEFGIPSVKVKEQAQAGDKDVLSRIKPNMFVQFGAYPLISHGKVIGAIGYSGGDDEGCVKAGWEYIQSRLPK